MGPNSGWNFFRTTTYPVLFLRLHISGWLLIDHLLSRLFILNFSHATDFLLTILQDDYISSSPPKTAPMGLTSSWSYFRMTSYHVLFLTLQLLDWMLVGNLSGWLLIFLRLHLQDGLLIDHLSGPQHLLKSSWDCTYRADYWLTIFQDAYCSSTLSETSLIELIIYWLSFRITTKPKLSQEGTCGDDNWPSFRMTTHNVLFLRLHLCD